MRKIGLAILILVMIPMVAHAQSASITATKGTTTVTSVTIRGIQQVAIDWVSNATGEVTATLSGTYGKLYMVLFDPSGTAVPSNLYDVTLQYRSWDVLIGRGANLSNTATAAYSCDVGDATTGLEPACVWSPMTLSITNAGNAKEGRIELYIGG